MSDRLDRLVGPLLVPTSMALGLAAGEALAWGALGRDLEVVSLLLTALAMAVVVTMGLALSKRWIQFPIGLDFPLALALLLLALPYTTHASARLSLHGGSGLAASIVLSVLIGGLGAGLARLRLSRVALAVFALISSPLALMLHYSASERPPLADRGERPDVLLIVMDTTRRDHLSLYGYPKPTTPQIDRFALAARVYEDAWSAAPWTPPSHATLFTGLLPAEHGVGGEHVPAFPSGLPSLPAILQSAGYRTAGLVANPNLLGRGWSRGFDRYEPPWFQGPHSLVALLNHVLMGGRPVWLDVASSDRILSSARRWWRANDDAPRFLFLNLIDPHDPYQPLEQDRRRFLPELGREESLAVRQDPQHYAVDPGVPEQARRVIEGLYDAEIAGLDRRLGEFFDWLEARGDLNRSLVVLTSDHGERLGERGMLGHLLVMDQHLLRVPLVLRFPPKIDPERVRERVQLQDVVGEVLTIAGIDLPESLSGQTLSNRVVRARRRPALEPVVVAQHGVFGWYADQLRARQPDFESGDSDHHWTLVADHEHALLWSPDRQEHRGRLVALDGDPSWETDLWTRMPEVRDRLLARAKSLPRYDAVPRGEDGRSAEPLDKALLERLRALGYAE